MQTFRFRSFLLAGAFGLLAVAASGNAATLPESGLCGHQGNVRGHNGNTAESIASAVRLGIAMVEFDVQRCKTGEFVLMHDSTIDNLTTGKGRIADHTLAELKSYAFRHHPEWGARLTTLDEALNVIPTDGIWINLHCYCGRENLRDLVAQIRARGRLHQTCFCSDLKSIDLMHKLEPTLIANNISRPGPRNRDWTDAECQKFVDDSIAHNCRFLQLSRPWAKKYSDACHAAGIRVIHFKSDDEKEWPDLFARGIDFIMTNRPDDRYSSCRGLEVLVSGKGVAAACTNYFPRVAKAMEIPVTVTVADDWQAALKARPWRVVVVNPSEATPENLARIKRDATNAVPHVESATVRGWLTIPVKEVAAACPIKDLSVEERLYLQGCTYLAMLTPADMIQLIWWPESMACDRAEKIRVAAEKVAWTESGKRADDAPQAEKARCVPWEELNRMPLPIPEIERLPTRDSTNIVSSRWSLGCETMDRNFAVFRNYRSYLSGTAAKHARIQSGWEPTEKTRGVYDFAWFDEHVDGLVAAGIKPWICLCYGNPIYNSSPRMRWAVARITEDKEGFPAWKRYVEATVLRYRDRVDTWEIWNEAFFKQVPYYTKLVKASAEIIKRHQPNARVWVSAPGTLDNCYRLVAALKAAGAIDLVEGWVYHPYVLNPDADHFGHFDWGTVNQRKFRELIASLGPKHYVVQGETGCPAQLEFSHALNNHAWTEVAQAKWNLRSMMRGAAENVRLYSVFSMIDNQYTDFMLQSFGLLRADLAKEVVYRRPLYFACRNVFSLFDDSVVGEGIEPVNGTIVKWADANEESSQRTYQLAKFRKGDVRFVAVWQSDRIPGDTRGFDWVKLDLGDFQLKNPVWVELITGRRGRLDSLAQIPIWDSPVLLMESL